MKLSELIENAFLYDYAPKSFIDLNRLRENIRLIRQRVGVKLCAVVKSDAYGHGLCRIAQEAEPLCDCFAVANFYEANSLRLSGVTKPIICLLPFADLAAAVRCDIEITVVNHEDFLRVYLFYKASGQKPKIHFAVNSGMNRFGYDRPGELRFDILHARNAGLEVVGVCSHFYNSIDYESMRRQYDLFCDFVDLVKSYYPNALAHIAASGGAEYNEFHLDMVRIGMLMYGYKSINGTFDVKPIMKVIAYAAQHRKVFAGSPLLYGDYKLPSDESVSLLSYGYFDGLEECFGINDNCMNVTAMPGEKRFFELSENLEKIARMNGKGLYKNLIRLGRVREKIYY